ncbi:nuclear transport factor 2 family protein [Noviherbaspirillum sp. Root189]|uniref:nuclear transport factor 2 family protein n=1 Tax=Noviherbaspirillum sp. Root189 TaxID=1736487 RepID=UPI00070EB82B|nr:nuclear transport factor 2 family protein [Noviherbaspirillum sp. Root189]KRB93537.1 hypothetical protein ASE07_12635 [Noviherbaspirillum sp. Root189]
MQTNDHEPTNIANHLLELEALRRKCLVERNFDKLETLFADDLSYTHSIGNVQDKPTYLAYVQGPARFLSIERDKLAVKAYGDVAVMTGYMTNTITAPNLEAPVVVQAFVTQVWKNDPQAGWQIVNFQATRLPVMESGK